MGDSLLPEISVPKEPHREAGSRKFHKPSKPDDVMSTITGDSLIIFRKKYHFPNDLVVIPPARSDRARFPPAGYITIFEMSLQAGLRFPLPLELVIILSALEICVSQFSCRVMTIVIGLIVFFREHNASLTPEFLARICRFTCDVQGRISCRSKWLDLRTRDPPKNWSNRFFFVKNDWGFLEKWGKLKDLPVPLHVGEEDILRALNIPTLEDLQYEIRYLHKYVNEESLFRNGLSIHAGRSHALMLKQSSNHKEKSNSPPKILSKRPVQSHKIGNNSPSKKKKMDGPSAGTASPPPEQKIQVLEEVLKHSCTGCQRADDLMLKRMDLDLELNNILKDWNTEFVKIKYLQGEYKRRYVAKVKEVNALENQLTECRTELSTLATSFSLQRQEVDRARDDIVEARADANYTRKSLKDLQSKVSALESENMKLQTLLGEKEKALVEVEVETNSKVIEDYKKSVAFKSIIQDYVQKDRDHIYDVEVKGLEKQCYEEGFLRGFLKSTRLVHRKTGADIEGLSPSQVSEDLSSDTEDDAGSTSQSSEEEEDVEII